MNDKQLQYAGEYTEGICGEAAAILKDGVMMTVPEILKELNNYSLSLTEIEGLKKLVETAFRTAHRLTEGFSQYEDADWNNFKQLNNIKL